MILEFSVKEQTIEMLPTRSVPRKGSRKYLKLQFHMSEDWNGLLATAFLQHDTHSEPLPITDGESVIVPDYFSANDYFQLFVLGINGDQSVPTNMITVSLPATGEVWASKPEGPNAPDYQELMKLVQNAINNASGSNTLKFFDKALVDFGDADLVGLPVINRDVERGWSPMQIEVVDDSEYEKILRVPTVNRVCEMIKEHMPDVDPTIAFDGGYVDDNGYLHLTLGGVEIPAFKPVFVGTDKIYVGSDAMPANCMVQFNPNGEILDIDAIVAAAVAEALKDIQIGDVSDAVIEQKIRAAIAELDIGGVSEAYVKTAIENALKEFEPPESGGGIEVSGAKVGDFLKVKEVDEKGVPTAWETDKMPTGGGSPEWVTLGDVTLEEDVVQVEIDTSAIEGNIGFLRMRYDLVGASAQETVGKLYVAFLTPGASVGYTLINNKDNTVPSANDSATWGYANCLIQSSNGNSTTVIQGAVGVQDTKSGSANNISGYGKPNLFKAIRFKASTMFGAGSKFKVEYARILQGGDL